MLTKRRVIFSLIFYLIVLIWIIAFKMNMEQGIFECMYYFKDYTIPERFQMTIGAFRIEKLLNDIDFYVNVVFFMPLGVYCFELIKKHSFIKGLVIAFLTTLTFETVQLLTTVGFFTFNDLIANTLGFVLGYFIYILLNKLLGRRVMYYVFCAFTVFFICLSVYGIINTAANIRLYDIDYQTEIRQ